MIDKPGGGYWTPFDGGDNLAQFLNNKRVNVVVGIMGVIVSIVVATKFLHPGVTATGAQIGKWKL